MKKTAGDNLPLLEEYVKREAQELQVRQPRPVSYDNAFDEEEYGRLLPDGAKNPDLDENDARDLPHAHHDQPQFAMDPFDYQNFMASEAGCSSEFDAALAARLSRVPLVNPFEYQDYTSEVFSSDDDDGGGDGDDDDNHAPSESHEWGHEFEPFYAESAVPAPLNIRKEKEDSEARDAAGAAAADKSWVTMTMRSDMASTVRPRPISIGAPSVPSIPAEYAETQRPTRSSSQTVRGSTARGRGTPTGPLDTAAAALSTYAPSSIYSTDEYGSLRNHHHSHDDGNERPVSPVSTVIGSPSRPVSPLSIPTEAAVGMYGCPGYGSNSNNNNSGGTSQCSSVSTLMPARRNWLASGGGRDGRFRNPFADEIVPEDSASCVVGEGRRGSVRREARTMVAASPDWSGVYRED